MTIELPDEEISSLHLTPEQGRLELAIGLYAGQKVSMGRAARIAGIPYAQFMQELGSRKLCVNYGVDDLAHDLRMVESLVEKAKS
jgi:predicted HTH domain antitoxin